MTRVLDRNNQKEQPAVSLSETHSSLAWIREILCNAQISSRPSIDAVVLKLSMYSQAIRFLDDVIRREEKGAEKETEAVSFSAEGG